MAAELVRNQNWRYRLPSGRGYPMLFPADKEQAPLAVPHTPATRRRSFENWIADVRRRGGKWPPGRSS